MITEIYLFTQYSILPLQAQTIYSSTRVYHSPINPTNPDQVAEPAATNDSVDVVSTEVKAVADTALV